MNSLTISTIASRTQPSISCVMPAHNEAANLPVVVAQVLGTLRQLSDRVELIIVDDGSRDQTAAVVERLNKAVQFALNAPEIKAKMLEMGVDSRGSSPEEMRDLILSDIKKWRAVIDRANIARQ